ncbi:MAG: CBS domain-containing protein [bacterium]
MEIRSVKELMVPRDQYAVVSQEATLLEAILIMEEAQKRRDRRWQPFRSVLVADENDKIVGKLGQLAFLKALQPQRGVLRDTNKLASAGVSEQMMTSMMDHSRFFQDNLSDLCLRAANGKVKDVMHPVSESIDENTLLGEAISKIIQWECLSVLVTRGTEVVGLLRLSDLCLEIAEYMKDLSN